MTEATLPVPTGLRHSPPALCRDAIHAVLFTGRGLSESWIELLIDRLNHREDLP